MNESSTPATGSIADAPAVPPRLCAACEHELAPRVNKCSKCGTEQRRWRRIATDVFWLVGGILLITSLLGATYSGWRWVTAKPVLSIEKENDPNQLHFRIKGLSGAPSVDDVSIQILDDDLASEIDFENPTAVSKRSESGDLLFDVQFAAIVSTQYFRDRKADILKEKQAVPVVIRVRLSDRREPLVLETKLRALQAVISTQVTKG